MGQNIGLLCSQRKVAKDAKPPQRGSISVSQYQAIPMLEMETEDTAVILLKLRGDVFANIRLDCVQRGYSRNCKVIGTEKTLVWDFNQGIKLFSQGVGEQVFSLKPNINEMYIEEIRHFLLCVSGETQPIVDGYTGQRVLEIALAAKASALQHQEVRL